MDPNRAVRFKRPMVLEQLITAFMGLCATFPDQRTGENTVYDMADIGMAAFSTFFMQSPSFLAQQTALARGHGNSNCQTSAGCGCKMRRPVRCVN